MFMYVISLVQKHFQTFNFKYIEYVNFNYFKITT